MPVNPNFSSQGVVVPGGYAQPSPGVTEQIETPADPSGNAYKTSLAASGTANLQTANYRDSIITAQAGGKQSAPSAATVIATVTPGTAGLWECTATFGVSGTTAVATDSNNFALNQTSTAVISPVAFPVGTFTATADFSTSVTVVLNLSGVDTVNVTAIANATGSSIYSAMIVCRRVG